MDTFFAGFDVLLRLIRIAVLALYFQRVLNAPYSFGRMLLRLAPVLAVFQAVYMLWPACYLFSSNAQPLLSGGIALLEAVVTVAALRLISKSRWAQIILFYSLALLISILSSLLLFALSSLFSGMTIATLVETRWNDFFSSFISAVLQMGLLIAVAEGVSHYLKKQTPELRFTQFAPVLGAEAVSLVILAVLMREAALYERMLPALAVLLLLYAIADGVLLSAFRAFVKNSELEHEVQLLQEMQGMQRAYYQSLDSQIRDMRRVRHDYRNVLQTVDTLLAKGEAERARGFAAECSAALEAGGAAFYTGNEILDAVLSSKADAAKGSGVRFFAECVLPQPLLMADADVMSIFANLLDNALEYVATLPNSLERSVGVRSSVRAGLWVLTFLNTYAGAELPTFETTKQDRAAHGYGTEIVRSIAQKYEGTITAKAEDGWLKITVTLNISLAKCIKE